MIVQGTPEWHLLRCGKVTASRVADIVRKVKSGGVSASRQRYLGELVAERLTGVPYQGFKTADMEWGNVHEESARQFYAFMNDAKLEPIAFVVHPRIELAGASPDHLVDDDGLIEVKCPATHTHLETLLGASIEPDYFKQIQWQLACTGRKWCDYVSYDPRMPERHRFYTERVKRDDLMIGQLEKDVEIFLSEVEDTIKRLEHG